MFKVSFKEAKNNPSKIVLKAGNTTNVLLKGTVKLPSFWSTIPAEISNWISGQNKVEIYENVVVHSLIIHSEGTSKCKDGDKYDIVLGERLAEARAKMYIYKFFYDLCYRLENYYNNILFGSNQVASEGDSGSLVAAMTKYEKLYRREIDHQEELLNHKDNG